MADSAEILLVRAASFRRSQWAGYEDISEFLAGEYHDSIQASAQQLILAEGRRSGRVGLRCVQVCNRVLSGQSGSAQNVVHSGLAPSCSPPSRVTAASQASRRPTSPKCDRDCGRNLRDSSSRFCGIQVPSPQFLRDAHLESC